MGDHNKSRRNFLFGSFSKSTDDSEESEMVKMLTPDGKLVEVNRRLLKGKSTIPSRNADILNWMKTASIPAKKVDD
jgi:major membrane immunogen (membrane-anchored lipoprotein)